MCWNYPFSQTNNATKKSRGAGTKSEKRGIGNMWVFINQGVRNPLSTVDTTVTTEIKYFIIFTFCADICIKMEATAFLYFNGVKIYQF